LAFNNGDQGKADAMQKQVDAYKASLVNNLNSRYPGSKLVTDYAVAVNDCAKKAVPQGDDLEALKQSLETLVKLAQQG
jgi:hypothetical protein